MILFPSAFGEGYLIANNYNQFGSIIIATVLLSYFDFRYTKKKALLYFRLFISVATVIIPGSLTSTMAMIILIYFLLWLKSPKIRKLGIYSLLVFVITFFSLFVVGQSVIYYNSKFTELMSLLGKDITFSGRTPMWIYALIAIGFSPVYGYGFYDHLWASINIHGVNPHNIILNLFLNGGVLLLILFIIIVLYVIKQIKKTSVITIRQDLIFSLIVFFLMSQLEVYHYSMIFLFLFILIIGSYYNNPKTTQCNEHIDNSQGGSDR